MKDKITLSIDIPNPFALNKKTEGISKKERLIVFGVGLGLFLLFSIYTYFVAREYLNRVDFDTTVRLQNNIPVRLDPIFSSLSLIGSAEVTGILFAVTVLILSWKKWRRLLIGLSFFVFHAVELLFKSIVDQVGPPFMFHRYAFDYHFPSTYVSTDYFSYPSGHVGRTALLVGLFAFIIWKSKLPLIGRLGLLAMLGTVFILMVVSRISLGEHWFSDVVGGALLGFSMAAFSVVIW